MTWIMGSPHKPTAKELYDLYEKHRLVPSGLVSFLDGCKEAAESAAVYEITEDGDIVAVVIVSSVTDGEAATIEFIPTPSYFAGGMDRHRDAIQSAMLPLLRDLFESRNVRRVSSVAPQHRNRTRGALKACRFEIEGRLRDAIQLRGREPEQLIILGMTRSDFHKLNGEV